MTNEPPAQTRMWSEALAVRLIHWGFDVPKLRFSMRTALALVLA
ncbi:hypothetical protein [Breoghania sp.]|nr:hypothetical protein [Breoghania sp.]MDJ0930152.1 hypothetical protein [Breoghania sp.]